MQLSLEDVDLFFRLHRGLRFYVDQKLKVLDKKVATLEQYSGLPPEARLKVHQALLEHTELIDAFADEDPFRFPKEDLEIVRSWKHLVAGTFYAFRQLQKFLVFLTSTEPVIAYGVVALFDPFEVVIGPHPPRMVKTTLLPFKGKIIYDGLVTGYNVFFGAGIKRRLNESYKEAKERFGVVTSLPMEQDTAAKAVRTPKGKASGKPKAKGTKPKPRTAVSRVKPKAARQAHSPLVGRWRITWMEMWDQSFVDAEVEGFVRFVEDGSGEFHFGYVHGDINDQETERNGRPAVVFSFEGNDEMDPCSGRGWAFRKGDRIGGKLAFHRGDESKFKAEGTSE
jgi:hypothetical protein